MSKFGVESKLEHAFKNGTSDDSEWESWAHSLRWYYKLKYIFLLLFCNLKSIFFSFQSIVLSPNLLTVKL